MTFTACRLCLQNAKLCNSHIIPEFIYSSLYDQKHRMTAQVGEATKIEQKGIREPLLCVSCEGLFSRWERVAAQRHRELETRVARTGPRQQIVLDGDDGEIVWLCQLSVLWRSGEASHPFFESVRLGPHAHCLRKLLLAGDSPREYPCITFVRRASRGGSALLSQPVQRRFHGHRAYQLTLPQLTWTFFVSSHRHAPELAHFLPAPNGPFVATVHEATDATLLRILRKTEK